MKFPDLAKLFENRIAVIILKDRQIKENPLVTSFLLF